LTAQVLSIVLVLIISVLFLGFEFALAYKNIMKSEPDKEEKGLGIKIIPFLIKDPRYFVSTMILGRITSFTILCYLIIDLWGSKLAGPVIFNAIVLILISFLIVLVLGSMLPTTIFKIFPKWTMNILSLPIAAVYFVCYPLVRIIFEISWIISGFFLRNKTIEKQNIKLFGNDYIEKIEGTNNSQDDTETEIEHDVKIFQNALEFSKIKLRECSIPRNEIEAVELNSPIDKLKERFIETGFSKILIYHETIDNIIGYVQSVDLFRSPEIIEPILKNLVIVPETMPANKLLNLFLKEHKSIALVVDEFGGTYGLATLEDIMEEIFGDIEDEHDYIDLREEKISDYEYIFSGRLEIDYINDKYFTNIPESDEYATLAGFILHFNEEIPKENDKIKIGRFEFEILKLLNPKIELVKLKLLK
jgi:CBS domain containing-hemolysin-like protein